MLNSQIWSVTPERVKQLYGRVLPIHLERAGLRGDAYLD